MSQQLLEAPAPPRAGPTAAVERAALAEVQLARTRRARIDVLLRTATQLRSAEIARSTE